jgi:hypothetical protein
MMDGCIPPADRAGKRKAEDEDQGPRLASAVKGKGVVFVAMLDEACHADNPKRRNRATATTPSVVDDREVFFPSGREDSHTDIAPQAQTSDHEELLIQIPPLRPTRKKSFWRVVKPPKHRARPTQPLASPSSLPRVWAGVRQLYIRAHSTVER